MYTLLLIPSDPSISYPMGNCELDVSSMKSGHFYPWAWKHMFAIYNTARDVPKVCKQLIRFVRSSSDYVLPCLKHS